MRLPSLLDTLFFGHGADRHNFRPVSISVLLKLRGKAQWQKAKPWPGSHQCHFSSWPMVRGYQVYCRTGAVVGGRHRTFGHFSKPWGCESSLSSVCSIGDAVKERQNSESSFLCPFLPGISAEFPAQLSRC